ncbi:MAG TPA: LysR substrate-binding domain-containing protein [Paracoccaceae bacterium]|nr:LysR substrate-binding domain-containing protein [Paracoccaceae bacterium]
MQAQATEDDLPNLRHLGLLVMAVERRSLTAAARATHISQPAASQAVSRLGAIFGAPLLERAGNAVAPTEEGQIVATRARRALDHLSECSAGGRGRRANGRAAPRETLERYATTSQLRALATVVATGSHAEAARRLRQSESSVQRACREIERIIGQPLFEGGTRSRVLSPVALKVGAQASLALKELSTAHAELRERIGKQDGRLVLGALPLARTRLVPDAIIRLMARYPDARVEVVDGDYDTLVRRLRFGTCDMIIGALRSPDAAPDLAERTVFTDSLSIVARKGHPLAGRPVDPADLARFLWILPRPDTPARRAFEHLAALRGLDQMRRGHVETGSLVVLRGLLLGSDALTLISLNQIHYEFVQGLLVPLDLPLEHAERAIGVTTLASALPGPLHRAFVEELFGRSGVGTG